jgi:hypothetical protein
MRKVSELRSLKMDISKIGGSADPQKIQGVAPVSNRPLA